MTAPVWCKCGAVGPCYGVTNVRCWKCPTDHEGGAIAALDEWCHRHNRYVGVWWRHPLGSFFWLLYRPLCNYRDRRLFR